MKLLRRIPSGFWPIGILLFLEGILVGANYKPGTWLMGWDNVMPEFHFKQALMTNFFGVWQEHRGLGLYDGMGHAANLVHTLFLWLLSLSLPTNLLRYSFHFLMHLLGGVGVNVLLKKLVNNKTVALAGAIFYLFNLATIQMFYTPLEAFSVHFAALPWLAWSLLRYLKEGSRQRFLIFLLISLLATPQFFIPTLLLPVGILLGSIAFARTLLAKLQGESLRRVITASLGFFLINAFWLLPYVYGLPHNAPIIQAAKINRMSSGEVFARNQAFGGLRDVLRIRGFPLDFEDIDTEGNTTYLMAPWREFLQLPFVTLGSWFLVAITILGIGMNGFLAPFIASLLFMANDTAIIKEGTEALLLAVPMLAEAYRFPFTKFSLLFAFSSSVFLAVGLSRIAKSRMIPVVVSATIIILALPAFRGNFFSDRLRVALPNDYLHIFAFMNDKPLGRIAYLPQYQYWSWKYYQWGYRGSGFAWYGLPQPLLDRAFDPWSNENENYYWELSRALYSKDPASLNNVFDKYDIRYILLDEHLISASTDRALYVDEIKEMLASLWNIKEVSRFGKLTVYERLGGDSQSFVSLKPNLPTVSPAYGWTDNDVAFGELGDYVTNEIASPRRTSGTRNDIWTYPFRSLFTKRSTSEREFSISDIPMDELVYDSTKSADLLAENVKPCGVLRDGTATAENLSDTTSDVRTSFTSEVKNTPFLRFTSRNQRGCLSFSTGNLSHRDGYLVTVESRHVSGRPLLFSLINDTARHVELETYLPTQPQKVKPFRHDYFILPPLASDGLGYSAYIANDAIGRQETINDIKSIKIYRIPYQELVSMSLRANAKQSLEIATSPAAPRDDIQKVDHPNPAYYRIGLTTQDVGRTENQTLVLSQSFDPGWKAWERIPTFPYVRQLKDHVLVNNWSNGWILDKSQITNLNDQKIGQKDCAGHCDLELVISIFFLPQLLQWLGFALLPIPFLWVWYWSIKKVIPIMTKLQ